MSVQKMPLISVLIPVYNVDQYLERCIKSVITQTYRNIEIILVDDGSTDNSGIICDAYAEIDNRIRVIHKKNGGLSDARNIGLENAKGKYISFIDSDDYVHSLFIEIMLKNMLDYHTDIIICGYKKGTLDIFPKERIKQNECKIYDSKEMLKQWHSNYKHIETVAWNKLYLRELFINEDIRYPKGVNNEDVQTTHLLVAASKKIGIIDTQLYYYFQRAGSIMHAEISEKSIKDNLLAQNNRLEYFKCNGYCKAYERLLIKRQKYYMLIYCLIHENALKDIKTSLLKEYKEQYQIVLKLQQLGVADKILFYLFRHYVLVIDMIFCFHIKFEKYILHKKY